MNNSPARFLFIECEGLHFNEVNVTMAEVRRHEKKEAFNPPTFH